MLPVVGAMWVGLTSNIKPGISACLSVCTSFAYLENHSSQSMSHLACVLLGTRASAVSNLVQFRHKTRLTFNILNKKKPSKLHTVQQQQHSFCNSALMDLQTKAGLAHDPCHVLSWGSRHKPNGD